MFLLKSMKGIQGCTVPLLTLHIQCNLKSLCARDYELGALFGLITVFHMDQDVTSVILVELLSLHMHLNVCTVIVISEVVFRRAMIHLIEEQIFLVEHVL